MKAQNLITNFSETVDAPEAVPRIRRLILDLAVRGKLVPEEAADEPAEALVLGFQAATSSTQARRAQSDTSSEAAPFEIPDSWVWTTVMGITVPRGQKVPSESFSYIDVSAIDGRQGNIASTSVREPHEAPSRARKVVATGDVLFSCVRPYLLNIAVVEKEYEPEPIASTAFAVLNGLGFVVPRYLWTVLRSPFFISLVEARMRGQAYPAINDGDFGRLLVPLAPLAEQERIVAKVDELMTLCDELEAAQAEREARRNRLVTATLNRLKRGASGEDGTNEDGAGLKEAARFYINHLPEMTKRVEHLDSLNEALLILAMRGRLDTQDPEDEPASILLERVDQQREELLSSRAIRKQPTRPLNEMDTPFAIPETWKWVRIGELGDWGAGSTPRRGVDGLYGDHINWFKSGELNDNPYLGNSEEKITERALAKGTFRRNKPGDVLIAMYGATIGRLAILEEGGVTNQAVCGCTPFDGLLPRYLYLFLMSQRAYFRSQSAGGAQPNISKDKIVNFLFPLPPTAEQRRIIERIEHVRGLLEDLKSGIVDSNETRGKLLNATVAGSLAVAD